MPVVKLKFPRLLMFSVPAHTFRLELEFAVPARKLALFVPPLYVHSARTRRRADDVERGAHRSQDVRRNNSENAIGAVELRLVIGALLVPAEVDPLGIVSVFAAALLVDELKLWMVLLAPPRNRH